MQRTARGKLRGFLELPNPTRSIDEADSGGGNRSGPSLRASAGNRCFHLAERQVAVLSQTYGIMYRKLGKEYRFSTSQGLMNTANIVQKLWNYCNVLRDDGMSYGDYVEQLTYLLFLKMADERAQAPYNQKSPIPAGYDWPSLLKLDGDELFVHYRRTLEKLGAAKGLLGLIFGKAQNKFQDPAKLRRLIVDLIDKENWSAMGADVKGDAYEGLLEKNAKDMKSGAGKYFTPRPLIQAIVEAVAPQPKETICDPACGTGGFLLAADDYVVENNLNLTKDQKRRLNEDALKGVELVPSVARLCAMNLMLHGIGGLEGEPIEVNDSLKADPGERFDIVLTNPPFGKKSSFTVVGENGEASKEKETYERDDFWATTSNKQLNSVQHIKTRL